jgi:hypothetical protein
MKSLNQVWLPLVRVCFAPVMASAQTPPVEQGGGSFRVPWPAATNLNKPRRQVLDAQTTAPMADYKWIREHVDRACQVNTGSGARAIGSNGLPCPAGLPQTPATEFHTSYMPVKAESCAGPQSCEGWQTVYDAGSPSVSANHTVACSTTAGQHVVPACDAYGVCTVGAAQLPASSLVRPVASPRL